MARGEGDFCLVTGASSGIGRALAVRLSEERRLILHGRNVAQLEETRQLCHGDDHLIWAHDLSHADDLGQSLADFLAENQIAADSFVHCAGIVKILPARSLTHAAAQEIMTVNFTSAMEITGVLTRKKVNQGKLRNILFVSSIWSQFGARGYTLYCASKGALDSAMRALAVELAPAVRVNSMVLGAIETPLAKMAFADPQIMANLAQQYPLGSGKPEDPAAAAAFLLSDQARWITGQQIVVDGGRTANMSLK